MEKNASSTRALSRTARYKLRKVVKVYEAELIGFNGSSTSRNNTGSDNTSSMI